MAKGGGTLRRQAEGKHTGDSIEETECGWRGDVRLTGKRKRDVWLGERGRRQEKGMKGRRREEKRMRGEQVMQKEI